MAIDATILVVDDEEVVLLSVRKALKRDSYTIDTVSAANKALAHLTEKHYDIMITDLMMPGMDGLQLLDRVKNNYPGVCVIMITGYATMATAMKAIRQGAFDFIAKPFTREELRSAVSRAVRHGPMEEQPEKGITQPEGLVKPGNLFTLRDITWAKIEFDGKVRIGIERKFLESIGELFAIDIPNVGDHVTQGTPCTRITAGDARVHAVWSPFSGRIVEANHNLAVSPHLALSDPRGEGWLIRIDPTGIEYEVENLSLEEPE